MINGDFVCTSANDGTHLFRPVSARAEVFWKENNFTQKYVVDNTEDYYIVKSVNSEIICNAIREADMDFTS